MNRECFALDITRGSEDQYDSLHSGMPDAVKQAIAEAGLLNYTLFRLNTSVVGYVEAHPDLPTCMAILQENASFQKWAKEFDGIFVRSDGNNARLEQYREIWHVD